ncbi:MAG: MarR family transcriptional regulator [Rhodospirillaceae bacterium]|nr:MarR family transcriptional regulator [Rhodospirillaceae bacterium]
MKKSLPASALTAHLGYWMRAVSNQVSQAFAAKLAGCDVTVAEWVVLRELYDRDAIVPRDLAQALGLTKGAVSKLVDRLHAKGLVTRASRAKDKRFQSVALTGPGRTLVPDLSALADRNDAEFFGHLSAAERVMLDLLLRDIVRRNGVTAPPLE